jgi:hypothetical protein
MGLTTEAENSLAGDTGTLMAYLSLLQAGTLQASASSGQPVISLDLNVAVGDTIKFYSGVTLQETHTVSSVTGTGPYSVTLDANLANTYGSGVLVSIVPKSSASAGVHEVAGITRVAAAWGAAAGGVINLTGTPVNITVGAGAKVGAIAAYSALTAGTLEASESVPPESFTSAGTFAVSSGSSTVTTTV